jgi:glycosyltransferase involved in cell wall biosynthesis
MRKFILNGISLTNKEIYGIHRSALELMHELDSIVNPGELEVVIPSNGEREFFFKNIEVCRVPIDFSDKKAVKKWNWFGFSDYVKSKNALSMDLTLSLPFRNCDIVAIYDCIIERCKPNANTVFKKLTRLFYMFKAFLNVKRAKAVVTCSNYSKDDIARLYHVRPHKIVVILSAWQHFKRIEPDKSVIAKYGLEEGKYFFALGSRSYHKNFKWIVEAAKQNPQYRFVVSGTNSLSTSDTALDTKLDNLIYAGYLSDEQVKALMTHCKAFLQPSLYEGFGIPPLEAMSTGARCIVSNTTSLPEIYGDSVWYIDPLDYQDINIDKIMSGKIEDNYEVLNKYSWRRSACKLYALMEHISEK